LAVCRVFTTAKRTGRRKREADWMLLILIQLEWTPRQARRQYRRRFGIESSYRCAGQVCGWTTSPNRAYRFLLIARALSCRMSGSICVDFLPRYRAEAAAGWTSSSFS
jgi:hypothetical protein